MNSFRYWGNPEECIDNGWVTTTTVDCDENASLLTKNEDSLPDEDSEFVTKYMMYMLVLPSLSSIQKGIQAMHALEEYHIIYGETKELYKWGRNDKAIKILNVESLEKLTEIKKELVKREIRFSYFNEEGLNDLLTALCLIVEDKVYDCEQYPDYHTWCFNNHIDAEIMLPTDPPKFERNKENYSKWLEFIGGESNEFLKEMLSSKKPAE